jgi:hypothetical protein
MPPVAPEINTFIALFLNNFANHIDNFAHEHPEGMPLAVLIHGVGLGVGKNRASVSD